MQLVSAATLTSNTVARCCRHLSNLLHEAVSRYNQPDHQCVTLGRIMRSGPAVQDLRTNRGYSYRWLSLLHTQLRTVL